MTTIDIMVVEGPAVAVIAKDKIETRNIRTLGQLALFISDCSKSLSAGQFEQLGRVAAVMASLDRSVVMSRDAASLGKVIDAHEFTFGTPENSRSFGLGASETLRCLREMRRRPDIAEIEKMLR